MQLTLATAFAITAFIPMISAHLQMRTPMQWPILDSTGATADLNDGPPNPLKSDGSNFPCHGVKPQGSVATYQPGSTQPLQLIGSAVHGGGSGQMSITYETNPTKNTRWGVMTSWEGNHPIQAEGNLDADPAHVLPLLSFKVPANLPAGKAVVAWTWFNRVGNREMYMQCATVTIGGTLTSKDGFNALPDLLRANSGNGCVVPEGVVAIKYKNPGPQVIGTGTTVISCDNTAPGTGPGTGGGTAPPVTTAPGQSPAPTRSTSFISLTTTGVPRSAPSTAPGGCTEGTIICTSVSTWSICAGGIAVPMGAVAAGTKCVSGQITKRDARLSHERRRHHV